MTAAGLQNKKVARGLGKSFMAEIFKNGRAQGSTARIGYRHHLSSGREVEGYSGIGLDAIWRLDRKFQQSCISICEAFGRVVQYL